LSQAHLYLNGTGWLTSVWPLMMRLSSAFTRLATSAAVAPSGVAAPAAAGALVIGSSSYDDMSSSL
jgi:hypothetical protein